MTIATYEGVIKNGQIHLKTDVQLPDKTVVYVVIPGMENHQTLRMMSPRLAKPEQVMEFIKEMEEVITDADI